MSSSRKRASLESTAATLVALLLLVLLPAIAAANYDVFMSQQEGRITDVPRPGRKYGTHDFKLSGGEKLLAWTLWFGGFPYGREVVKHRGTFWAEVAPCPSPPAWKRKLSLFMFVPAVLLPALFWPGLIIGALCSSLLAAVRGMRRTSVTPEPTAGAPPGDVGAAGSPAPHPVSSLVVVEREGIGCPTCGVETSGAVVPCGTCGARHFESCWATHRTCNDAGCDGRPVTRRAEA